MRDVHSKARLGQGKIQHLAIRLRPDFDQTTIYFRARYIMDRPVRRDLHLDARDIHLDRARSHGTRLSFDFDQDDPLLGQRLVLHDLHGSNEFVLEGKCSPTASALQWLTPQMTTGGLQPFLYTQCQAIHARSLFPCQDTPAVRFTFDAEVEIPDNLTAVMGAAFRGKTGRNSLQAFRFRMPQPIPSYLFALAVGDLEFRPTSKRCGVFAEPGLADAAAWEFGRAEAMIQIAESMYGPYLWGRYDILVLPKGFPWGGMENPRLTFLSPSLIAGDRSFDRTVAHELGHAWTGNLVTNATWEDFWLNEGWTTYIQQRLDEAIDGTELVSFSRRSSADQLSAEFRRLKEHPERTALKFAMEGVDPDEALSSVPYVKGSMFLHAIEQAVGRERFDRFARAYIRRFSFRPITTDTFLRFLKAQLPGIDRRVPLWTWIYRRGLPPDPPRVRSDLYRQVRTVQSRFKAGFPPTRQEVSGWHMHQICMFLDMLPEQVSLGECLAIEEAFALKESKNYAVLGYYYPHAVRAGYKEVLPRIRSYLATHGILFYLRLVFGALAATGWSREQARQLYAENRPAYHPITQRIIEQILSEAGMEAGPPV
jgi:leukotriene-A4 hydrolase